MSIHNRINHLIKLFDNKGKELANQLRIPESVLSRAKQGKGLGPLTKNKFEALGISSEWLMEGIEPAWLGNKQGSILKKKIEDSDLMHLFNQKKVIDDINEVKNLVENRNLEKLYNDDVRFDIPLVTEMNDSELKYYAKRIAIDTPLLKTLVEYKSKVDEEFGMVEVPHLKQSDLDRSKDYIDEIKEGLNDEVERAGKD